jgi:protein TonB
MEEGRTDRVSVFASVALHGVLLLGLVLGLGGAGTAPGEARDHIVVELGAKTGAPDRVPVRTATPVSVKKAATRKPEVEPVPDPVKATESEPVLSEPEETVAEVIETAAAVPVSEQHEEISRADTATVLSAAYGAPDTAIPASESPLTAGAFTDGGMESDMGVIQAVQHRELRLTEIRTSIQDSVNYPALARKRGLEGEVLASFLVGPDGMPRDVRVVQSSGYRAFDREVLRVIHAASPYPAVDVTVEVPVMFRMAERQE